MHLCGFIFLRSYFVVLPHAKISLKPVSFFETVYISTSLAIKHKAKK